MQNIDVTLLPATAVPAERMTAEPLADVNVDDIVVVYSRGTTRLAQVTKVGPKRVEVVYTTKGAWDAAAKIQVGLGDPGYVERIARHAAEAAECNYSFSEQMATGSYPYDNGRDLAKNYDGTPDVEAIEQARQRIAAETREQYVARKVEAERARAQRAHDEALAGGVTQYVHVTTKSVPRTEVFGLTD